MSAFCSVIQHSVCAGKIYLDSIWLIKTSPCLFRAAISGEPAALLSPFLHLLHCLIFPLKSTESPALLTHTDWNLTHVSKSFLFPTGAFRGYQTPAKPTSDRFSLPPCCSSSLRLLPSSTEIFISLLYLSVLHLDLFRSHFHCNCLSRLLNLARWTPSCSSLGQIERWAVYLWISFLSNSFCV